MKDDESFVTFNLDDEESFIKSFQLVIWKFDIN